MLARGSTISCMKIFLTGATGFVGKTLLQTLLKEGHAVIVSLRRPDEGARLAQTLQLTGDFQFVAGDVVSGQGLEKGMTGCNAVIHLVGIILEKGSNTFENVHHLGTRNVVEAAKKIGIRRFVQMSALGVRADGVADYQTSKWRGEEEVRHGGIPYCIMRPSLIFGHGGFVGEMTGVMRRAPLFRPVPGDGLPKFRPIAVEDVALCFTRALSTEAAINQTIDLGGADELTLNQVLNEIAMAAGITKPAVNIPMSLMKLGARLAQLLPTPPVTVGQLRMLEEGSTCDIGPMRRIFNFTPKGFSGWGAEQANVSRPGR
jgi:uncharacterized protein YbjT (DUF2867 family)